MFATALIAPRVASLDVSRSAHGHLANKPQLGVMDVAGVYPTLMLMLMPLKRGVWLGWADDPRQ